MTQDANSPTAVDSLTSSGSSVGTVAYMSPEQARGEALDARSDVFSLGVVLYEMATGQHPFSGTTTAVVFDHILNHAPVAPVSLNAQLPVEFENILNKTLEKDRDLRCQSAAELRADLKRLQRKSSSGSVGSTPVSSGSGSSPSQVPGSGTSSPSQSVAGASSSGVQAASSGAVAVPAAKKSSGWVIGVAAVVILAAAGFAAWRFWPRAHPFASVAVNQITNIGTIENVALSADGKFLAEVKNDKGQRTLWVRNIATNTDSQILGAFANSYLGMTFSPDANYLYFTRGTPESAAVRALYAMPIFGGTPKQLAYDVDSTVSFAPDGNRFVYVRWTPDRKDQFSELHIADKDGGNNQVIYTDPNPIEPPVWSPDGSRIAWVGLVAAGGTKTALYWIDVASKKVGSVAAPADIRLAGSQRSETNLAWLPDGSHLLALFVKPHTDRSQIGVVTVPSGEFHPITNDVNTYSQLTVSADGRTIATVLTNVDSSIAYYRPEGGAPTSITPLRITPTSIAWMNEGRLLFNIQGISIGTFDKSAGSPQTFDVGDMQVGGWLGTCPDGHILFTGLPKGAGQARLFRMNGDGSDLAQLTTTGIARAPYCSPDSQQVYFTLRTVSQASVSQSSVWVLPLAGGTPKQLTPPSNTIAPVISPDGKLVGAVEVGHLEFTFRVSDLASGRPEGSVPFEQSLLNGGIHFSPDSRAIVYPVLRNGGNTLLYQPIDGSTTRTMLDPVSETIPDFAWSPSGKQLAVVHVKSSSDVVLITDQTGNGKN